MVGNKIAPGWLDAYLARTCYDAQMTGEPEEPDRPDNLWEPVDGRHDYGERGPFGHRSRKASWQFWAESHRCWFALAGGCLASLACVALMRGKNHD